MTGGTEYSSASLFRSFFLKDWASWMGKGEALSLENSFLGSETLIPGLPVLPSLPLLQDTADSHDAAGTDPAAVPFHPDMEPSEQGGSSASGINMTDIYEHWAGWMGKGEALSLENSFLGSETLIPGLPVLPPIPLFQDTADSGDAVGTGPAAVPFHPDVEPSEQGGSSASGINMTDIYEPGIPESSFSSELNRRPLLSEEPAVSFLHSLTKEPISVQCQPVHSSAFAAQLTELLAPVLDVKSERLVTTDRGDTVPVFLLDSGHTQQILTRLLSIAASRSENGSELRFITDRELQEDGTVRLRFVIQAPSCNLPEDVIPSITAGIPSAVLASQNLALNLGLCQNIAMLLGGFLLVHSEKGAGTLFLLELPARAKDVDGDASPSAEIKIGRFSGKHILLAETNSNATADANLLQKREMIVHFVPSDHEAVRLFQQSEPGYYAAILTDHLLLADEIRRMNRRDAPLIPILGILCQDSRESVTLAFRHGLDFCLIRPFSPRQMFRMLDSFLL